MNEVDYKVTNIVNTIMEDGKKLAEEVKEERTLNECKEILRKKYEVDANFIQVGVLPLRLISKGEYISTCLLNRNSKVSVEERWDKISKGHNFVLGVDCNSVYSVNYIDELLEGK